MNSVRRLDAPATGLVVRAIDPGLRAAFVREHRPGAGIEVIRLEPDWTTDDLGWFQGRVLVGVATVTYQPVRGSGRRLAQLPDLTRLPTALRAMPRRWLPPLAEYLTGQGVFALRIESGPALRLRPARSPHPAVA